MRIVLDKYRLQALSKSSIEVIDDQSYIAARKALLEFFIHGKERFDMIYVAQEPFTEWFGDLSLDFLEVISPKSKLGEKYPTLILDKELSDQDVMELDLLNLNIEPTVDNIFKHFTGVNLPQGKSFLNICYELSMIVVNSSKSLNASYINRVWHSHLSNLSIDLGNSGIINKIQNLDEDFCRQLSMGIYLCKNPLFFDYWLNRNVFLFFDLGLHINQVKQIFYVSHFTPFVINTQYEVSLKRFLLQHLNKNFDLEILTGSYAAELEAFLELGKEIDNDLFEQIQLKFDKTATDRQLYQLGQLVLPELQEFPDLTDANMKQQAETLKKWSINSFIPYKFYYDKLKNVPDHVITQIDTQAKKFGDWLFQNFRSIYLDDDIYTNMDVVRRIHPLLKEGNKVVWLIVDGFPSYYLKMLERILKENGINSLSSKISFATLPTITEIAMPIMVAGKFEQNIDIDDLNSRQSLLEGAFPDSLCIYSSQPGALIKDLNSNYDLCCVHLREIDSTMHKGDNEFVEGREAEIEFLLRKHISIITSVIKNSPERKMKLVLSTDHGATKCLVNGNNVTNTKLNNLATSKPRERSVPLSKKLSDELVDDDDVYRLSMEMSRNRSEWAIARGYKYFGRNDAGYRHGGLTPEEVVVPVIIAEIKSQSAATIKVAVVVKRELQYGKTEKDFVLRIRNSESETLKITEVGILEEQSVSFNVPLVIEGKMEADLSGMIKLHPKLKDKAKDGNLSLTLSVGYEYLGERFDDITELSVPTQKDTFDDFDF